MTSKILKAVLLIGFVPFNCIAENISEEDIFELSLQQLSHVRVTGAAVRSLNLSNHPFSNNPFGHSNLRIPVSIDVVDSKTIEARGLNNVVEVVESMVGVLSGESPSEPYSFSMRGFTRNSIGVLYDGVSMGMSTLNMRPQTSFNLDRVEVVKGASVLNASEGSSGGSVNIITKKPIISGQSFDVHSRYGRFNTQSYNLGLNASTDDKSAYRIDLNSNSSDGWVDDTASDSINASFSYLLRPTKDVEVLFYTSYAADNLPAYWGTPLVPLSAARDPDTGVISSDQDLVVDLATRYNNYNVADSVIDSQSNWLRLDMDWQLSAQTQANLRMYQFSADRLWENAESYSYNAGTQQIERDRLLVKHQRYVRGVELGLTHQFNAWDKPQKVALNFISSTNDFTRDLGSTSSAPDSVDFMEPIQGLFGNVDIRYDKQTSLSDAAVLHYYLDATPKWQVSTSARFERMYFDRLYIQYDGSVRDRGSLDKQFNQQRYFLGTSYEVFDDTFVYAHYSKQHDAIENSLVYYYDIANLTPPDVYQYELGYKSILSTQTELSLALYQIEKNQTYQLQNMGVEDSSLISQGAEFAIKHNVSDQFRIGGNYAFTHARYGQYYDSASEARVDGNTPENVPETMLSAWLSINDVLGVPIEWGLGYTAVSARYANGENTIKLKPYELINVFMAYQGEDYRAALSVRNLTDEVYAPWSDVYYPNQVALGSPRTVEASLRMHF